MRIIVTENQFNEILKFEDNTLNLIHEQLAVMDEKSTITIIQQKINEILNDPKKEKDILNGVRIQIKAGEGSSYFLQIGKQKHQLERMAQGVYALIIPEGKSIATTTLPMSTFMAEIEKIPEYKSFIEDHPEAKELIAKGNIFSKIYTEEGTQGLFKFTRLRQIQDRKESKLAIPISDPYPLGEFLERKKIHYRFTNGTFGVLEAENLLADLTASAVKIDQPEKEGQPQDAEPVGFPYVALGDIFNLNDVTFKNEGSVNQLLHPFVQMVKETIEKFGSPFVDFIKSQNPTVYGFASIDGNPEQEMVGEYKSCSGYNIRKDYDLCLSTERAKIIADLLNQSLPELDSPFQSKGMGETDRWGPRWTEEQPTIPEQTAPNRRFLLTPIKPYTGKQPE